MRWSTDPSNTFYEIEEYEAPWNTGAKLEGGNRGHRPTVKGGYFPVPPVDSTQDMRAEMSLVLESLAHPLPVGDPAVAHLPEPSLIGRRLASGGRARAHDARRPGARLLPRGDGPARGTCAGSPRHGRVTEAAKTAHHP